MKKYFESLWVRGLLSAVTRACHPPRMQRDFFNCKEMKINKEFDKKYFKDDSSYNYLIKKEPELAEMYKENVRKSLNYTAKHFDFTLNNLIDKIINLWNM